MTTLQEQINPLSKILERELRLSITGAELSTVFGRKGLWAYGVIAEHLNQLDSPDNLHPRRARLIDIPLEDDEMRFCLQCQQERQPVTFSDVIASSQESRSLLTDFGSIVLCVNIARSLLSRGPSSSRRNTMKFLPKISKRIWRASLRI
jgi:hypothetical protein